MPPRSRWALGRREPRWRDRRSPPLPDRHPQCSGRARPATRRSSSSGESPARRRDRPGQYSPTTRHPMPDRRIRSSGRCFQHCRQGQCSASPGPPSPFRSASALRRCPGVQRGARRRSGYWAAARSPGPRSPPERPGAAPVDCAPPGASRAPAVPGATCWSRPVAASMPTPVAPPRGSPPGTRRSVPVRAADAPRSPRTGRSATGRRPPGRPGAPRSDPPRRVLELSRPRRPPQRSGGRSGSGRLPGPRRCRAPPGSWGRPSAPSRY